MAAPELIVSGDELGPFDVRRAVVVGVVAVLVLAGAALTAYATAGDVPRGTRVLGLDLGAKSRTGAEYALRARVDRHAADPIRIRLTATGIDSTGAGSSGTDGAGIDGTEIVLPPAAIGLRIDVDATVSTAMRGHVRLRGHRDVAPVVRLDETMLAAALRDRLDPRRVTMPEPGITSNGLTSAPAYPASGLDLDLAAAAAQVRADWPRNLTAEVALTRSIPLTARPTTRN